MDAASEALELVLSVFFGFLGTIVNDYFALAMAMRLASSFCGRSGTTRTNG